VAVHVLLAVAFRLVVGNLVARVFACPDCLAMI